MIVDLAPEAFTLQRLWNALGGSALDPLDKRGEIFTRERTISSASDNRGSDIVLSVADNGLGIGKQDSVRRGFQRFDPAPTSGADAYWGARS